VKTQPIKYLYFIVHVVHTYIYFIYFVYFIMNECSVIVLSTMYMEKKKNSTIYQILIIDLLIIPIYISQFGCPINP